MNWATQALQIRAEQNPRSLLDVKAEHILELFGELKKLQLENARLKEDLVHSRNANANMRYWKELEEATK